MTKILDTEERITNIEKFINKENENGPVVGFYLGDYFVLRTFKHANNLLSKSDLKPTDIDLEGLLSDYQEEFEKNKDMYGSSIWGAEVLWSIPWFEAIIGARIEVSKSSYTAVAHQTEIIKKSGENGEIYINEDWESALLDYIKRLVDFSNGRFPVVAPLLRGPSDILSIIFGYENTLFKIFDEPDLVKNLLDSITGYYLNLRDKIFEILPLYFGGSFIYCRNLWLPGKSFPLQEDAAGSIMSPDIYKKFVLGLDNMVTNKYPNLFYHLHSSTYKVLLDSLLTIDKLKVIEIWVDLNGPSIEDLIDDFKKILHFGKALYVWSEAPMEQIEILLKNLPNRGRGVFLEMKVQSKEEAKEKIDFIENFYK